MSVCSSEKQLQGLLCSSYFCMVVLQCGLWWLDTLNWSTVCLGCYIPWLPLWSGGREGKRGQEKSLGGGCVSLPHNSDFALIWIQKFRHSCEMNLQWVWVEQRAEHMETKRPSRSSHCSFFHVLLISYLHITWALLFKLVGFFPSEISVGNC